MLTDDQEMINEMLLSLMTLTENIEDSLQKLASNGDMMTKKYEHLMKLHKSLMKSHRIALKIKAIENYGDDYNEE